MSRIRSGDIAVDGLAELGRALKQLENVEARREMREASKEAANVAATGARGRAYSLGGVAAHAAASVGVSAGMQSAGVTLGGPAHPEAGGAEFGGGARPTTRQFKPWRGSGPGAGYFVYPSIRDNADRIAGQFEKAIDDIIRKAGLA